MRAIAAVLLSISITASAVGAERSIDREVVVDAPVATVWQAWTTRDGIVGFFAPDAEIDPRPDGAFHIFINPYAPAGSKGADTMRFLAVQPMRMLSFDWNAPPSLAAVRGQRTVVVLRFKSLGERTKLTLHHAGWGASDGVDGTAWDDAYRYFDEAWGFVLANLQRRYAPGGAPKDWSAWLKQMREDTPTATPTR